MVFLGHDRRGLLHLAVVSPALMTPQATPGTLATITYIDQFNVIFCTISSLYQSTSYVPETLKSVPKPSANRVLTSDKGYNFLAAKES